MLRNLTFGWWKYFSLARNGKYSIMYVMLLDLVDFAIQLEGVRGLAKLYDWYLIAIYCGFIGMNGIISGLSITYLQQYIGVEGEMRAAGSNQPPMRHKSYHLLFAHCRHRLD